MTSSICGRRPVAALLGAALAVLAPLAVTAPAAASRDGAEGTAVAARVPTFVRTITAAAHPEMASSGIDVDPAGNLYVADTGNDQVAKYSPTDVAQWRKPPMRGERANGTFSMPRDVAYANGRVYVADTGNNRIQVLDAASGTHLATWTSHFTALMGVSTGVDGSGAPIVLASDSTTNRVKIFTAAGTFVRDIGRVNPDGTACPATTLGCMNQARDAITDARGNVYVADFKYQRVQVFSPTGTPLHMFGSPCPPPSPANPNPACPNGQFKDPYGIDRDDAGNIYVSDNRRIQKFTPYLSATSKGGAFLRAWGTVATSPTQAGALFQLRRVAVGPGASPSVFAADLWGYKILQYAQTATTPSRTFGGKSPAQKAGAGAVCGLNKAYGFHVAPNGKLYIADTNNQRIQECDPTTGRWIKTWAQRGFGAEDLTGVNWPRDIQYNATTATLWLADTKNYRVSEVRPDTIATGRVIGTAKQPLKPSVLHWPYSVASYGADVIVADTFNNRILRCAPANPERSCKWDGVTAKPALWTATGFGRPRALTLSGSSVFVADTDKARVVRLDAATGRQTGSFGAGLLGVAEGIAVAPNGNIWVADVVSKAGGVPQLVELSPTGALVGRYGTRGTGAGQFISPSHLQIVQKGAQVLLYSIDPGSDRLQIFDIT